MKKLIIKFIRKSPLLYRWIKKSWFFLNNYNNIDNILCEKCNKTSAFYHHKNITLKRDAGSSCVCGINLRNNAELKVIKDFIFYFLKDKNYFIYNTSSVGSVHEYFKNQKNYTCSDYFDDVKLGEYKNGIRCENLEELTFQNESFDIVITEEVFEHIKDYKKAFREINRVLKKGGAHIFTIPLHEGHNTIDRYKEYPNTGIVYHGDYLRDGVPVYTDFGDDIIDIIREETGMNTKKIMFNKFFENEEITFIDNEKEYSKYLEYKNKMADYFKYNNMVFLSIKN